MLLTITLGSLGYLAITAISFAGGMGVLQIAGVREYGSLTTLIFVILAAGVLRAVFRLSEQYCTHYIAFRLLAIIREKVFKRLRLLTENQLKEIRKGELMNIVTKDVELLEVFYAHTIAPVFIWVTTMIIYGTVLYSLHPIVCANRGSKLLDDWLYHSIRRLSIWTENGRGLSEEVWYAKQFFDGFVKRYQGNHHLWQEKITPLNSIDAYSDELNHTTKN